MLNRATVQEAVNAGKGVLRLEPCWVPRSFTNPGRRLKLHPDDLYAFGAHRGGINERWFSSSTKASNDLATTPDEGLSYVHASAGSKFLLKDAVESADDLLLGSDVMEREKGWNLLCKFFDNLGPIPHHMPPRFFDVAYRRVLKAVCARNADRVKGFAENWGYQSVETDWRALAGKMVLCEKPLGRTAEEAKAMVDAVEKAKVPNMVWYNYRRVPAVVLLKKPLDEDRFGRIVHYRSQFLQDWTISQDLPQGGEGLWRLDSAVAGSGVTGDLLAHNIDMALWLNGPITEVSALTETFVKQRKHNLTGQVEPVKIDDASAFLCRFQNGSLALFEATGHARGHKARSSPWRSTVSTPPLRGTYTICTGSITSTIAMRGNSAAGRAFTSRTATIGYEHTFIHQVADFLVALDGNRTAAPTFRDGLATDYVTDAVLKSAKTKKWEAVPAA